MGIFHTNENRMADDHQPKAKSDPILMREYNEPVVPDSHSITTEEALPQEVDEAFVFNVPPSAL